MPHHDNNLSTLRRNRGEASSLLVLALIGLVASSCSEERPWPEIELADNNGLLRIEVRDAGTPMPARIELLDASGREHIPNDALLTHGDCEERRAPMTPPQINDLRSRQRPNYFTGTTHFYTPGRVQTSVSPGRYRLRAFRGLEYRVAERDVEIHAGETTEIVVELERWIHMASNGWYSADAHLHIPRADSSLDADLATWMRAEDLHVANLLRFGNSRGFSNAYQYAFGPGGTYEDDGVILVPGQENPRVSFLGHVLILGPVAPIHYADDYFSYRKFLDEAERQGAISGIAHKGAFGGDSGLSLLLPYELVSVMEVLTRTAAYGLWYEALNAGFHLAPIAGTDFPCGTGGVPPGAQRFYTKLDAPFSLESWTAGLMAGNTFVTNGPMVELSVDGVGVGDELRVPGPRDVSITGSVTFDPAEHDVNAEVVAGGRVVATFDSLSDDGVIEFSVDHRVDRSTWLALRASGFRVGYPQRFRSYAHTAPVYVTPSGAPRWRPRQFRSWRARLDALEASLAEGRYADLAYFSLDGVTEVYVRDHRRALLRAIRQARRQYNSLR